MSGCNRHSPICLGLTISQGSLMNMFACTALAFDEKKGQALALLCKASFFTYSSAK